MKCSARFKTIAYFMAACGLMLPPFFIAAWLLVGASGSFADIYMIAIALCAIAVNLVLWQSHQSYKLREHKPVLTNPQSQNRSLFFMHCGLLSNSFLLFFSSPIIIYELIWLID